MGALSEGVALPSVCVCPSVFLSAIYLIAPFVMLYLVSGISSFCLFVNLILVPVPQFPTHLFRHPSLLPLPTAHP